jgi:hypothetical protein
MSEHKDEPMAKVAEVEDNWHIRGPRILHAGRSSTMKEWQKKYFSTAVDPLLDHIGQFVKVSDVRMTNLVNANLYYIDGDYARPNLRYCRPGTPVYHRVGAGWEKINGRAQDDQG